MPFAISFKTTVTGAPMVASQSMVSPLVTLKHGSGGASGIVKPVKPTNAAIVKPKQEVFQKKEEEVGIYLAEEK